MTTLPPARRIITAHSSTGAAVVLDDQIHVQDVGGGFAAGSAFITPVPVPDAIAAVAGKDVVPQDMYSGDVQMRWVDIHPETETALHWTPTVDLGIITHGTLELAFHEGEPKVVNAGDVVVQLGSIHAWHNRGKEPARIVFVVLPSKAVEVDGKTLDQPPFSATKF